MDQEFNRQLKEAVRENRPILDSLIQKMIQTRSYSGEEGPIVEFLVATMKEFGFDQAYHDSLGNAVGVIGDGPVKILFDGHIDTVKVTETENWPHPPFDGKIVDGKIFGRGVVDEKSAVAGFIVAGKILKECYEGRDWPFTLTVVGSVQEEDYDGYPLYHLIEKDGNRPDYVVLGEPTNMRVLRGHRGRMELKLETRGVSAHGAHNEQGINAIYKMSRVIQGIEKLNEELQPVDPLIKGSATVSEVRSHAPSLCSVSDFCQIHVDRRLTVGETRETVIAEMEKIAEDAGVEDVVVSIPHYNGVSWKETKFSQEAYFPTWILEKDHPLVEAGLDTASEVLERKAEEGFWGFSTNGVATAGLLNIPTIGFAPGLEELAHSSNEYIVLEDLHKACEFYVLFPFTLVEKLNQSTE